MNTAGTLHAAEFTTAEARADSLRGCKRALELLLTHRGNPAFEVERVLADDPQCGMRRMLDPRSPHHASLRREPRPVRPHPSHVHRGGIARAEGASRLRAGGGAGSSEASEPAQSAAEASPG